MSSNLIIFDIDGTLTNTADIDSDIFLNAFAKQFNIKITKCSLSAPELLLFSLYGCILLVVSLWREIKIDQILYFS